MSQNKQWNVLCWNMRGINSEKKQLAFHYWIKQPGFFDVVQRSWAKRYYAPNAAAVLCQKLKTLRYDLKQWSRKISKLSMLIDNCNKTLLEIDDLEERRRLSAPETNFRVILKQHLLYLLDCQKAYWKKRCTVRYFKFGDGYTKFFHRVATERYRRNSIASLRLPDNSIIHDHVGKEAVLFQAFKERLGCSNQTNMKFDLPRIIKRVEGLQALSAPFTHEEIGKVIKEMPAGRATVPDGFSGSFIKSCWQIIKDDFYRLCSEFHAADLLQAAINDAYRAGDLQLPMPAREGDYPVIQYADDTILVMPADEIQAETIKSILQDYVSSVRLRINFQKSTLIIVNTAADTTSHLAQVFGCSIGAMPFTYLGLPMGTARPTVADLMPLVSSVERKLSTAASLLDLGSKLTLVNSVITSLAIYVMCSIRLPPKILDHLDKLRRYCLWAKNTNDGLKAVSMAAWDLVCRPKHKGGLGVLDLKIQNQGLLLKQLHKFYNHRDIPWVDLVWNTYYDGLVPHASGPCGSFWWKDVMNLAPTYRAVTSVEVGDGSSTLFWKDAWHGDILADSHPRLFSFAKHEDISVKMLLTSPTLGQNFYLPLLVQARDELDVLQTSLASLELTEVNDAWHTVWGSEELASSRFYLHCFRDMEADDVFKWIWKAKCTNKWKVFAWLLLADRLNTRGLLKRKHTKLRDDNYACLLCHHPPEETVEHLFFHCEFSKACWGKLGIAWPIHGNRVQLLHAAKNTWGGPMFMDVFIVASWSIWKEHNNMLFRSVTSTIDGWSQRFKGDFGMMRHRIKEALVPFVDQIVALL
ncbi:uncharacterized protein [Aegilops tauschii subsp. strangulata]|uniref:uncharacterized protein n=1 Tax=Aegilops tauschii subsp. strangulata TaxID=200361 RepID=UPI000989CBBF|nr:uncharacterized protein LOC109760456 [Aegilops tauschii subsp. strangulata]